MSWEATLYTDWACAGGTVIGDLGPLGADCVLEETLDASAPLVLTLDQCHWDRAARRRVVRLTLEDGSWSEWRIDRRDRRLGRPTFRLEALPPLYDLRSAGLVRERLGGRLLTAFAASGTIRDILSLHLLRYRDEDGLGWLDLGTIEPPEVYALQWQRLTRFALVQLVRSETRFETALRRVGTEGYVLDVVRAIGADAPIVRARFGDQVHALREVVPDGSVATVIAPYGLAEGDSGAYAGPAQNAWRVAEVVPTAGGDWCQLRDPETGALPFVEDDQLTGYGIVWPGGGPLAITGALLSTGRVRVAGTAPAVGTLVTLCQDATGAPLEAMTLRSGLSESGRVVAELELPGARGERNLLVNAAFADGTDGLTRTGGTGQPWGVYDVGDIVDQAGALAATASAGATSMSVTGFPPHTALRVGEFFSIIAATIAIGTGARTGTDGKATVGLVDPLPFGLSDGTVLPLRGPSNQVYGLATVDGAASAGATTLALRALQPERNLVENTATIQLVVDARTNGRVDATAFLFNDQSTETTADYRLTFGLPLDASILSTGFSRTVRWTAGATEWSGEVIGDYVAGDPQLTIRVTQAMTFSWAMSMWLPAVDPFPGGSFTLRFNNSRESPVRTITGAPGWAGDRTQALTVGAAWTIAATDPNDPGTVQRTVRLGEAGGSPVDTLWVQIVGGPAAWDAAGTTVTLLAENGYGPTLFGPPAFVHVIPAGATLRAEGQSAYVREPVTLDADGAGTVPVTALPATSVAGSAIVTRRCPGYLPSEADGGPRGPSLLFITGGASAQEVRWPQVTIPVPPGDTVAVVAKVWLTLWSPLATGSVPALLRLTDGSWTTIEEIAPDPNPTPIPAVDGRGLPEYRTLTIEHVLSATTTLGLALRAGGTGIGPHQAFVRGVMLTVGSDAGVPFTAGAFANVMIHTANTELLRAGRPQPDYEVTLAVWDQAVAPLPDVPAGAIAPITLGGRVLLEDVMDGMGTPRLVRVVGQQRTPSRPLSRVTLGALDRTDLAYTVGRGLGTLPGGR